VTNFITKHLATSWKFRGSNPGVGKFSAPVQTGPGAYPVSYTVGTVSLSWGLNGQSVALTTHPHLTPRSKKE